MHYGSGNVRSVRSAYSERSISQYVTRLDISLDIKVIVDMKWMRDEDLANVMIHRKHIGASSCLVKLVDSQILKSG